MDKESADLESNDGKLWRGTSLKDMSKGKGPWSFAITPLVPSKYHCVLYEMPVTLNTPPKPHRSKEVHLWDDDHVRMPYSDKNLFSVSENSSDVIKERWKIICEVLSVTITNSQEFEIALSKYNSSLPKLEALHYFFNEELDKEESNQFFAVLLPKIIALATRLPELLPNGIPLLKQNHNRSLSLSQLQIACLLANAFLCTFPWKRNTAMTYPGVNFVSLFSAFARPRRTQCVCEKFKSICNYFRRIVQNVPVGVVTFERKMIPRSSMPRWDTLDGNLSNTKVHVTSQGTIEDDGLGFLQVDFANKNIGGGVLRYGCVQEEIRFIICPELIISRLFVEQLGNGESVIITGAERYSNYTGYGDTFEWAGDYRDQTPFDVYGRRRTAICVIDATRFNKPKDQFQSSLLIRELNKAYVGFSSREKDNLAPVATGNWGCGAFKGSKQLKTLIQLMACTQAKRDLVYYSKQSNYNWYSIFDALYEGYPERKVTNALKGAGNFFEAQLWRFLCQFSTRSLDEDKLYAFIQQAHFDKKSQPTISHFFAPKKTDSHSPSTSFNNKRPKTSNTDTVISDTPTSSQSSSSEDMIESSQPEPVPSRKFIKAKLEKNAAGSSKLPTTDICQILDALDGNGNNREKVATNNTEEVLSVFYSGTTEKTDALEEVVVEKMEIGKGEKEETQSNKPTKKKITDFFTQINK